MDGLGLKGLFPELLGAERLEIWSFSLTSLRSWAGRQWLRSAPPGRTAGHDSEVYGLGFRV